MDAIAIIPARGGSIGLPGKNVRPLLGMPLVARTVKAALQARQVATVYVSTDDAGIARVAAEAGATVVERPDDLSGSTASSESALLHVLDRLREDGRPLPEHMVFLQCTSPFTRPEDIDTALETLVAKGASAALSVVEDHGFIWHEGDDGFAEGITHDHTKPRQRRQDMKPRYRENGAIYAMRVADFLDRKERFCGPVALVSVPGPAAEIDDQDDWDFVEAFLSVREQPARTSVRPGSIAAVVTDFDGVHTDDRVQVSENGVESVSCNRRDGLGLELLRKRGTRLLILSKEANPVVRARAAKLKMEVLNQVDDKLPVLDAWCREQGLKWSEIVYIGNDVNDIDCMKAAGLSFAPADAHETALAVAGIVLKNGGGKGALREMCDYLISEELVG
ncbi:CMP-N,N'-diacetyllegionaminic acid synthase [Labrenzia sp. THAF82]|uniref:acylneuraminate cytidylyltransferase n=1 Tax=Labrenzia sp. THAF82 TaxID=2587861 RepID=UPI0012682971|nr:acylneuraminate cytidylyltransferase [Labrenzia sp. THAF82]QFT34377.1 CMP-N,N'-diacetyllegionaminic acid synthase [Labrenzia sp. THAF82]